MTFTKEIFSLLADNKKFPAYQAERRIDIFLNLFIEDILKLDDKDKESQYKFIAPEFPLRIKPSYQSTKIDYLCLKETPAGEKEILLVELKTDAKSFDEDQLRFYLTFKDWNDCLDGLVEIIKSGRMSFDYRLKYFHLINTLITHDLVSLKKPLPNACFTGSDLSNKVKLHFRQSLNDALSTIIQQRQYDVKVIYIAPGEISKKLGKYPEVELISFKNICKNTVVKRHLEEWKLMRGILLKDL